MELKKILIAQVVGGVFHTEDIIFQTDVAAFLSRLSGALEKSFKEKKLKDRYILKFINDDKHDEGVRLKNLNNDKIEIDIRKQGIVFEIGAIVKQGNFFYASSPVYEVAKLINLILLQRKQFEISGMGVKTTFAIPYTKEIALDEVDNILKLDLHKKCKFWEKDKLKQIEIAIRTQINNVNIDLAVKSASDQKAILVAIDFRDLQEPMPKTYVSFLNRVKPLYAEVCQTFIAKVLKTPEIDVDLLMKNISE